MAISFQLDISTRQPVVNIKIIRPYCVLNSLETCKDVYGTSKALKEIH